MSSLTDILSPRKKQYTSDVCIENVAMTVDLNSQSSLHTGMQTYGFDDFKQTFVKSENLQSQIIRHTGRQIIS